MNPWITGEQMPDGTWRIRVPFSEHNFETGNYFTHIYAFDKDGVSYGIGGTTIAVQASAGGSKETDISGVSYDVFMYGVNANVKKVEFPTWTAAGGQDDIEWIQGQQIAPGVWRATVVYSKHNAESGKYFTHIYADGSMIGHWEFNVTNQVKYTYPSTVSRSSSFYEIKIDGVPSHVTHVWFPTWTDANGQDDLEDPWIEGERIGANSWRIAIPFYRHNNEAGTYITHIYAGDAYGNMQGIKGMTVSVQ